MFNDFQNQLQNNQVIWMKVCFGLTQLYGRPNEKKGTMNYEFIQLVPPHTRGKVHGKTGKKVQT